MTRPNRDDRPVDGDGRTAGAELLADGGTVDGPDPPGGDPEPPPSVPADAVAVDVACPHCGRNPVESMAKGYRITGMLLVSRRKTLQVVGCQACIRRQLLVAAGKNLLVGWWGVFAAVMNLFAIPWNVVRAFVSRGPTEQLVATLADSGIPFEFVRADEQWDPTDHDPLELYVDGLMRLSCAAMAVDGGASDAERETLLEVAGELFEEYSTAEVAAMVDEHSGEPVDVGAVSRGLAPLLTPDGKELVLNLLLTVASADGELSEAEAELVAEAASGLDLSEEHLEALFGG